MADGVEKTDALNVSEKKDTPSRRDESLEKPTEAPSEPKPGEPSQQDGWSAYWVREDASILEHS